MLHIWAIKKDGKFVRDFSDGLRLTTQHSLIEKYTSKKAAEENARYYGRMNGKGYHVVQMQ